MVKETCIAIIKVGTITYTLYKAFKVIGKPDFGNMIALAGIALSGISIMRLVQYWISNPPLIIRAITVVLEKIAG